MQQHFQIDQFHLFFGIFAIVHQLILMLTQVFLLDLLISNYFHVFVWQHLAQGQSIYLNYLLLCGLMFGLITALYVSLKTIKLI